MRDVDVYAVHPWGLYMARPTPGRAQFHYLESWLLPSLSLRVSGLPLQSWLRTRPGLLPRRRAHHRRRPGVAHRGPLPGPGRPDRRRGRPDRRRRAVRGGPAGPGHTGDRRPPRCRRRRPRSTVSPATATTSDGWLAEPRNGPHLEGSVKSAFMSLTKRGLVAGAAAAALLFGAQLLPAVALADPGADRRHVEPTRPHHRRTPRSTSGPAPTTWSTGRGSTACRAAPPSATRWPTTR